MTREEAWVKFAAAIVATGGVRDASDFVAAGGIADRMLDQWAARFGDAAYLLEGQMECAACHRPLPPGVPYQPSTDGVKFCNAACLTASGREE